MEEKSLLIQFMGNKAVARIIDFLIENKGMDFSKEAIAKGAKISRTALFNNWEKIEQFGLVKITRRFGKAKLYTLNSENEVVQQILTLEFKLIEYKMKIAALGQEHNKDAELSA